MDITQDKKAMDLYSRQIATYGLEAMGKLITMRVLIVGLRGLGIETAKNLTLAGPGSITIYDDTPTTLPDLGVNFFLTEEDVGKPRAEACKDKLHELNGRVNVRHPTQSPCALREHNPRLPFPSMKLARDFLTPLPMPHGVCLHHWVRLVGPSRSLSTPALSPRRWSATTMWWSSQAATCRVTSSSSGTTFAAIKR